MKSQLEAEELASQVKGHILNRLTGRLCKLQVIVRDEGLIIRGYSRTYHAKQLAQHAAAEISPLPVMANEIEVK